MRLTLLIVFVLLYQFIFSNPVFAVTLTIDNVPAQVDGDADFEFNVTLTCSGCKDSYLRAVFFKDGTTNYFGYTQNEKGDWVNVTADKTLYYHLLPEQLTEGSWSGKLKAKADLTNDNFKGPELYSFKLGRYTSANSSAAWSTNQTSITINSVTPSSTPTTISPTPTKTPTPSSPPPSATKTPTPSPKPPPTSLPSSSSTKIVISPSALIATIAGLDNVTSTATPSSPPPGVYPELNRGEGGGQVAGDTTPDEKPFDSFTFSAIVLTIIAALVFLLRRLHLILKAKALQ